MTGARCIFPDGRAMIVAYNEDGKMLLALPCRPKRRGSWVAQGFTSTDRKRLARALVQRSEMSHPLFAATEAVKGGGA